MSSMEYCILGRVGEEMGKALSSFGIILSSTFVCGCTLSLCERISSRIMFLRHRDGISILELYLMLRIIALLLAVMAISSCLCSLSDALSWKCIPSDHRQRCSKSLASLHRWKRRRRSDLVSRGRKNRETWCLLGVKLHPKQMYSSPVCHSLVHSVSPPALSKVGKKKIGGSMESLVNSRTLLSWILKCSKSFARRSISTWARGWKISFSTSVDISAIASLDLSGLSTYSTNNLSRVLAILSLPYKIHTLSSLWPFGTRARRPLSSSARQRLSSSS